MKFQLPRNTPLLVLIMLALGRLSSVASFLGRNRLVYPPTTTTTTVVERVRGGHGAPLRVLCRDFAVSSASPPSAPNDSPTNVILEPLVVCGPSGVGKGTIIQKYMDDLGGSDRFCFSVSHTTRKPRPGEEAGVHYHFTSVDKMQREIRDGRFLEHAQVHGNYYGTSWQTLEDAQRQGKRCLLDIDVQGVKHLKSYGDNMATLRPKYIFVAPPSLASLLERLEGRGTETAESLAVRTANAKAEVAYGTTAGNFDRIVVNDNLDRACREFQLAVESLYDS